MVIFHSCLDFRVDTQTNRSRREDRKRRQAEEEWLTKFAEEVRQRNEFLALVTSKLTGNSALDMAPLQCNPRETQRAVFLVTTPIAFGVLEVSQHSYKLLARHVGMSLNSVSHWAVCVIDRGLGKCYCYDLMSDRLELTMLGKNYFRVAVITPEFVDTWSSCYYIGETTKTHDEIQEIGESPVEKYMVWISNIVRSSSHRNESSISTAI
jgi:hypothetical protein